MLWADPSDRPVKQLGEKNFLAWQAIGQSHEESMRQTLKRWTGSLDNSLIFVSTGLLVIDTHYVLGPGS